MAQIPTQIVRGNPIIIKGYKVNQDVLTKPQLSELSQLSSRINRVINNKDIISFKIRIVGHTDSTGSELYNKGLGMRRAKNAELHLKKISMQGENVDKIHYDSKSGGETAPISSNATAKTRFNNRRLELTWELEIIIQPKKIPKIPERPKKDPLPPAPYPPDPYSLVQFPECPDLTKWIGIFGETEKKLMAIYSSTSLWWEYGHPIGLKVIRSKGFLSNFTAEVQAKIIDKIKTPIENKIFGESRAGVLGAVLSHVQTLKMVSDDVKNKRIMGATDKAAKEARRTLHRKLVCALFVGEDLQTGSRWLKIYNTWEKMGHLRTLCAQKRGDKVREPQIGLPPDRANTSRSNNYFQIDPRGIKDKGFDFKSILNDSLYGNRNKR